MSRLLLMLAALCVATAFPAAAGEAPDKLTIGYDGEGEVDASPAACAAFVKDTVEWPEAETHQAVENVCEARKRHVEAYDAVQKSYRALVAAIGDNNRLDAAGAAKNFAAMVKACIDYKSNLTTGGHNVMIDIIPNDIAVDCLNAGKKIIDEDARRLAP